MLGLLTRKQNMWRTHMWWNC